MKKILAIIALLLSANSSAQTFTGIVKDVYPVNQGQRPEEFCTENYEGNVIVVTCKPASQQYIIVVNVRNQIHQFRTMRQYHVGDKVRVVIEARLEDG